MTSAAPSLWHHPDFVKLWSARTVSLFGDALTRMALPLLATITLHASPAQMGLLAAMENAPSLIIGLFAGVLVDRFRRRSFMVASDLGRGLLLLTIPLAALVSALSMAQLYLVALLAGALTVVFNIASRSYLPSVVDRPRLVEGNSKLAVSGSVVAVAGPSLAGVVIQAITAPFAILLDALSFFASCLLIAAIHRDEVPLPKPQSGVPAQVREGLRVVLRNPLLAAFAGCMATSNFMSNIFYALYMLFGVRELGLTAAQLGLVYGIGAAGSLVAAVLAPPLSTRLGTGRAIVLGALLGGLEVVPVVFAARASAIPLLILSSLLGNFGWVLYSINETSVRQAVTPAALQGRMNATFNFIVAGMLPLGALAGGTLGQVFGLRQAIAVAAAGSGLSVLWVVRRPVRSLARPPDAPAPDPLAGRPQPDCSRSNS